MLTAKEIYVLGKAAVTENRDDYYRRVGSDIISQHPEKFIANIDITIARLERVKNLVIEYQGDLEEEEEDEPEW